MCYDRIYPGAGRPTLRCRAQVSKQSSLLPAVVRLTRALQPFVRSCLLQLYTSRASIYHMRLFYSPDHSNRDRLPARTRKP